MSYGLRILPCSRCGADPRVTITPEPGAYSHDQSVSIRCDAGHEMRHVSAVDLATAMRSWAFMQLRMELLMSASA